MQSMRTNVIIFFSTTYFLIASCTSGTNDKVAIATDTKNSQHFVDTNKIIHDYIYNMNDPQVKIVSDEECAKWKENVEDYHKEIYKFAISDIRKLEGDLNADKKTDLIVSYFGDNCWQGIGAGNYLSNFFFLISDKDTLRVDEKLTNIFKQTFLDTLTKYYPDNYTKKAEKANFVNDVNFSELKGDTVKGTFSIMQCGASPCLSGDFGYRIRSNLVTFKNLERREMVDDQPPAKLDKKEAKAREKQLDEMMKALNPDRRKSNK